MREFESEQVVKYYDEKEDVTSIKLEKSDRGNYDVTIIYEDDEGVKFCLGFRFNCMEVLSVYIRTAIPMYNKYMLLDKINKLNLEDIFVLTLEEYKGLAIVQRSIPEATYLQCYNTLEETLDYIDYFAEKSKEVFKSLECKQVDIDALMKEVTEHYVKESTFGTIKYDEGSICLSTLGGTDIELRHNDYEIFYVSIYKYIDVDHEDNKDWLELVNTLNMSQNHITDAPNGYKSFSAYDDGLGMSVYYMNGFGVLLYNKEILINLIDTLLDEFEESIRCVENDEEQNVRCYK